MPCKKLIMWRARTLTLKSTYLRRGLNEIPQKQQSLKKAFRKEPNKKTTFSEKVVVYGELNSMYEYRSPQHHFPTLV